MHIAPPKYIHAQSVAAAAKCINVQRCTPSSSTNQQQLYTPRSQLMLVHATATRIYHALLVASQANGACNSCKKAQLDKVTCRSISAGIPQRPFFTSLL
jgi:hypothetical protein